MITKINNKNRIANCLYIVIVLGATHSIYSAAFNGWKADRAYIKGDATSARRLYEEATLRRPHDMEPLYNVGVTAHKLKDYAAAQAAFEKVAQSSLSSPKLREQAFFNLGDAYLMDKEYQKALKAYEEVLKINSANDHAKRRIELVKKLLAEQDQQKQSENNKDQQGKDKKQDRKEESENSQNDSNQQKDSSQDQSSSGQGKKDSSENGKQQSKENNKGQQDQTKDEGKERQGQNKSDQHDSSQTQSRSKAEDTKEQEKNGNKEESPQNKQEHTNPQKQDSNLSQEAAGDKKETESTASSKSIPENQLDDQEKQILQIVESNDKNAYKAFIKGHVPAGDETDGYKNW